MNLTARLVPALAASIFVAATTALVAGCAGMMPPPGAFTAHGPVGHANAGAGMSVAGHEPEAASQNNCITETRCNYNSDCAGGTRCNTTMHLCFEPDPVASTILTCGLNQCTWNSECPTAWSCNSATHRCQLR